jgi:hypothetical protein
MQHYIRNYTLMKNLRFKKVFSPTKQNPRKFEMKAFYRTGRFDKLLSKTTRLQ